MRYLLAFFLLLAASPPADQQDPFDQLDDELEREFQELDAALEAQYQALDRALEDAYERLSQEVAQEWGTDEVELPTNSAWVDYSDDKQLRRKIDFEKGVVQISHLAAEDSDMAAIAEKVREAVESAATDDLGDLAGRDQALQYARADLARQSIPVQTFRPRDSTPVVGPVMPPVPSQADLSRLVRKAKEESSAESAGIRASVTTLSNEKQKVTVEVPLRLGHLTTLASKYQQSVLHEARRQELEPSLVYAIIETESHFNPRARSQVPAFGLMQLVPRSGGVDAYDHVYGQKVILDPEYLYDPQQNVELGAAYLHLLFTRYLRHVENTESRKLCTIAAYNTGAGNVARSFVGTSSIREAAKVINGMSPEEVYGHLLENLPHEETRRYLPKVLEAQKKYQSLDRRAALDAAEEDGTGAPRPGAIELRLPFHAAARFSRDSILGDSREPAVRRAALWAFVGTLPWRGGSNPGLASSRRILGGLS